MTARVLLALTLATASCAQYQPLRRPTPRALNRATELPFTTPGGHIVIPVQLGDDPTPLRFVVDTARHETLVTPAVADRHGLQPRRARYGGDIYGVYRDWVAVAALPKLRIAGLEFVDGEVAITDLDTLSQALCEPIDGVLGLEYPRGFAYEIDYLHSTFRLAAALDQLPPRLGGWQFPHLITIASGPQPFGEFIDLATAASDALVLYEKYAGLDARLEALGVPRENVVDSTHGPRFAWPDRTVAGLDLRGVDARIDRKIFQTYLGAKILRAFTIRRSDTQTWLYPNGRAFPRGLVSFGFSWDIDGGEAHVRDVSDPTLARGLTPNMQILALGDQRIAALTPRALCQLHRDWEDGPDTLRITVGPTDSDASTTEHIIELSRRPLLPRPPTPQPSFGQDGVQANTSWFRSGGTWDGSRR